MISLAKLAAALPMGKRPKTVCVDCAHHRMAYPQLGFMVDHYCVAPEFLVDPVTGKSAWPVLCAQKNKGDCHAWTANR